ncbi:hypothetical protein BX600DRAFT_435971 [Xylariales sp. PMI_506]|nr:hypothetical protein BX600DRAFT_435971 [Xylariales sp. PMI_506]
MVQFVYNLRLGDDQSKTYGLVSRHVAIADKLGDNVDYRYADPDSTDQDLTRRLDIVFSLSAVEAALDALAEVRTNMKSGFTRKLLQRKVRENRATGTDEAALRVQDHILEYSEGLTSALEAVLGVTPAEVNVKGRTLGHVVFSPKLEVHSERGLLRDWALIELDKAQFQHEPENKVFIGNGRPLFLPAASFPALGTEMAEYMDDHVFLRISGTRELQARKREAYHVGKYGRTTGLTFGIVGEIEAVLRRPLPGKGEVISWALLIVSPSRKEYPGEAFSASGDSGSCIFDMFGKAVGILDAGQAYSESDSKLPPMCTPATAAPEGFTDFDRPYGYERRETQQREVYVTFAMPMEWLLEDIEKFTGLKPTLVS